MHARPFFVHPYAQGRGNYGISAEQRRPQSSAATVDNLVPPARRSPPAPAVRKMMAEMKVSLAINQLSQQVMESRQFWQEFRDEYLAEVESIKYYVGVEVLQQIWRKKIEFNSKDKHGDERDDQQFSIQSMKLESCLTQVDEATELLAEVGWSDYSSDYDSRQHHLSKVRGAGSLVVGLSKRSVANEAACTDLLEELAELEKLVDSRSATANMLPRIGKHQSEDVKIEGATSNRPGNADADKQMEHDYNEKDNPSGWLGNNGENIS
ncbi:hypothetical protein O1611_g6019 [Lasiodiplodia mahajangana]|uniref:Uncharacterized protein n=1 Tax=Lasiodiplodia mahajangana TaxID=1108764 RepID=A0ACC2JK05_9PEZI|nr:hypothetical protein O1611_g6019 [Lasiodiplodia mahajangana]